MIQGFQKPLKLLKYKTFPGGYTGNNTVKNFIVSNVCSELHLKVNVGLSMTYKIKMAN